MGLNIIGHRKIFLTISGILVAAAVVLIIAIGFRPGIDFTGGTLWQFRISPSPSVSEMQSFFANKLGISETIVNFDSASQVFLVRFPIISENDHQQYISQLTSQYPSFKEDSFQSVGPSVSDQLRQNALISILLVLIGISLYVAFAFRKVSRPVSSWKYGAITLITLFHDVSIPAGFLVILGKLKGVEIDTNSIVALLVVMGFSVHDTIVVFDRIRENLLLDRGRSEFGKVINDSINQTMARSINTSLTLFVVLMALFIFGPITLKYFVLTLIIGTIAGAYSSIFVASPLLQVWQRFSDRRR